MILSKRWWTLFAGLAFLALLLAGGSSLSAETTISKEYQVKAIFLFNFAQFVKWPPTAFSRPQQPFCIGILGNDPFDDFLDETVSGEKVDGHPLVVQRFKSIEETKDCQILFISRSEKDRMEKILGRIKGKEILTIGDTEGFIKNGGLVRFLTENNRIHLRINLEAAKKIKLKISSKVLRLAEIADPEKD